MSIYLVDEAGRQSVDPPNQSREFANGSELLR